MRDENTSPSDNLITCPPPSKLMRGARKVVKVTIMVL